MSTECNPTFDVKLPGVTVYDVLTVQYEAAGRSWKLHVRLKPQPSIILDGNDPTMDEIVQALSFMPGVPVYMVHLVYVMAHVARRVESRVPLSMSVASPAPDAPQ